MNELENYIATYFNLTREETEQVRSYFKLITVKKGDYFLKESQYSKMLAFVQSGMLREFLYVDDKEITKWISTKGYFAVDLSSFLFNQPAKVNYQALEDSELYIITKSDFEKIGDKIPRWKELKTLFLARCFSVLEDRVVSHLSLTAEERYNQLFKINPNLFLSVQSQHLASMLGMSAETLSRIRKKQT